MPSLIYSKACVLSVMVHCPQSVTPPHWLGHIKEKEGERKQNSRAGSHGKEIGGAALCRAGLEQISRLADSSGRGSDASVIRD